MKKPWKRFNKLMKKGRIHRVVKAAGLKNEKTDNTDATAARSGTRTDTLLVRNGQNRKGLQKRK